VADYVTDWAEATSVLEVDPGGGEAAWTSPGNLERGTPGFAGVALDDSLGGQAGVSRTLRLTGFGFAIPDGATVVGVEATIDAQNGGAGGGQQTLDGLALVGVSGGAKAAMAIGTGLGTVGLGGDGDDWGATDESATLVSAAEFGLELRVESAQGAPVEVELVAVRMRVHFDYAGTNRLTVVERCLRQMRHTVDERVRKILFPTAPEAQRARVWGNDTGHGTVVVDAMDTGDLDAFSTQAPATIRETVPVFVSVCLRPPEDDAPEARRLGEAVRLVVYDALMGTEERRRIVEDDPDGPNTGERLAHDLLPAGFGMSLEGEPGEMAVHVDVIFDLVVDWHDTNAAEGPGVTEQSE
jgi:hypothetical protein